MEGDAELALHGVRHGGRGERRRLGAALLDEVQDGLGALVGALGSARAGQQAGQPPCGEGGRGGVEGLAADAEGASDFGDRPAVDAMAAQHFVLHLDPIAAIEELLVGEGGVLYGIRAGVEGADGAQGGDLGILGRGRTSPSHDVKYNTYTIPDGVKELHARIPRHHDGDTVAPAAGSVAGRCKIEDEIRVTRWTKYA